MNVKPIHPQIFSDKRGVLHVIDKLPFLVRRLFTIHIHPGQKRADHAHKREEQLLYCVDGVSEVLVEDGAGKAQRFLLSSNGVALYVSPLHWLRIKDISLVGGSTLVVLSSHSHDEANNIRDYDEFKRLCGKDPV